ncbi:MAG: hypothetical protein MUE44_03785 [Oscillatoriaceae cyanobacterium Prado104]|nr:hypothetical protein [Oscillatoriaceae cyanobacterium Prado104]
MVKVKLGFHKKAPLSATVPQNYSTNNLQTAEKLAKYSAIALHPTLDMGSIDCGGGEKLGL